MKKELKGFIFGVIVTGTLMTGFNVYSESAAKIINVSLGNLKIKVEGNQLDVGSFILDGRTYVPLRKICEGLNREVVWRQETKLIEIKERQAEQTVNFENPFMEKSVRNTLDRPVGNIYQSDLEKMKSLRFTNENNINMSNLNDLKHFLSLEHIVFDFADLDSTEIMKSLKSLQKVEFKVATVKDLSGLTEVKDISFYSTSIKDTSSIGELKEVRRLSFGRYVSFGSSHSHVLPKGILSKLSHLEWLHMAENELEDESDLLQLPKLKKFTSIVYQMKDKDVRKALISKGVMVDRISD